MEVLFVLWIHPVVVVVVVVSPDLKLPDYSGSNSSRNGQYLPWGWSGGSTME